MRVGLLDTTGRLVTDEAAKEIAPALADRSPKIGEERVFILHRPTPETDPAECVYLSQRDVRELQFAKAAISTGWSLLLEQLGLEHRDVQQVLLAGSFGSYLSPPPPSASGWSPSSPCCGSSRRATSPARAPRWRCCLCASAPARSPCWRR